MKNKTPKEPAVKNEMKNTAPDATMNHALKASYQKIVELRSRADRSDAETSYEIGVEIQVIKSDEDKYGRGSVELLAQQLGRTPAALYSYASVVESCDWSTFKNMLSKRNKYGLPLTFSHFVEVAKIQDVETRNALLNHRA